MKRLDCDWLLKLKNQSAVTPWVRQSSHQSEREDTTATKFWGCQRASPVAVVCKASHLEIKRQTRAKYNRLTQQNMHCVLFTALLIGLAIQKISAVPTASEQSCSNATFPINLDGYQIEGLNPIYNATTAEECRDACCKLGDSCIIYQWSEHPPELPKCWAGPKGPVVDTGNYTTRCKNPPPPAPPQPPVSAFLTIDIEDTNELVRPELYGHDLE